MAEHAGIRHGTSDIVGGKNSEIAIFLLLIWPTAFILCAVQPAAISLVISTESSSKKLFK